ncbi:MAG: peptidoglycan D,D-transpeptidase FtsI family protein [Planctomycetota bacterium]|jgi:cell division protein FtsI (penicillin-binding protein 3)
MTRPLVSVSSQSWHVVLCAVVCATLFAWVTWRLHVLQVSEGGRFTSLASRQQQVARTIRAARGGIYDRDGQVLVHSESVWNLYADAGYMNDRLRTSAQLVAILGLDADELRERLASGRNGQLLAQGLTDAQAEQLNEWRSTYRKEHGEYLQGLTLKRVYRRSYAQGGLGAHVLGFVLDAGSGGAGIEQSCQTILAGEDGREFFERDARGRPLIGSGFRQVEPRHGANVQLTIDSPIQAELESALAAAVERHGASNAAGVVVRPATGDVVALASWPIFAPADYRDADPESFRNNALAFVYESGSTMKPLIAGAAVADALVSWQTRIDCEQGRWTYRHGGGKRTIHSHAHGVLSVSEGIAKSDNILMAKLGLELGPDRLHHWVRHLGFGARTGIELPGENRGVVHPRDRWSLLWSCMSVPMGHEIQVTPLQMAMAHAAVANDGVWHPPRLIKRIYDDQPGPASAVELAEHFVRPPSRRLYDEADARAIEAAMVETMTNGTGRNVQLRGWSFFNDTATTEKLVDGRYAKDRHIGSFVAWAPAEADTRAEYLCLVVVDDPRKAGHYGSQTAAPVVQQVLQFALDRNFGARSEAAR